MQRLLLATIFQRATSHSVPVSCSLRSFHAPTALLRASSKRYRGTGQQRTAENAVNPLTKPSNIDKGALHVVSVPIGNLKDFSLRAIEVLRKVDYIVCTNRQITKLLLEIVDIDCAGRLIHYRPDGNSKIVDMLRGGRSIALVAPSGTPCIGDGGSELVREMIANQVRVTSVPGPSAVTSALSISGVSMSGGSFFFGDVLPDRLATRVRELRAAASRTCPSVYYVAGRQLVAVLMDLSVIAPQRRVAVVHEATKLHESLHGDTAQNLARYYQSAEAQTLVSKGQMTLVVEGASPSDLVTDSGESKQRAHHQLVQQHLSSFDNNAEAAARFVANSMNISAADVLHDYHSVERSMEVAARKKDQHQSPSSSSSRSTFPPESRKQRRAKRLLRKIRAAEEKIRLKVLQRLTSSISHENNTSSK